MNIYNLFHHSCLSMDLWVCKSIFWLQIKQNCSTNYEKLVTLKKKPNTIALFFANNIYKTYKLSQRSKNTNMLENRCHWLTLMQPSSVNTVWVRACLVKPLTSQKKAGQFSSFCAIACLCGCECVLHVCVLVSGYHSKKEKSKATQQPFSNAWKYGNLSVKKLQSFLTSVISTSSFSSSHQAFTVTVPSALLSSWNPPHGSGCARPPPSPVPTDKNCLSFLAR